MYLKTKTLHYIKLACKVNLWKHMDTAQNNIYSIIKCIISFLPKTGVRKVQNSDDAMPKSIFYSNSVL